MDRFDAMTIFVAALEEGSLAAAGRKLGRSPATVGRAVTFLEQRMGVPLLHRTTRSIRLSEVGKRYADTCRRVLTDLREVEALAAGERSTPRGTLNLTAPVCLGEDVLRPILDAFLDVYPSISAMLNLLDQPVSLIEEGVDVALKVGHLPDSSMVGVRVGEVRRVLCAAQSYLAKHPPIVELSELTEHQIIATTQFGSDAWSFPAEDDSLTPRIVHFKPRVTVNSVRAAQASAVDGRGLVRLFSHQVTEQVRDGRLVVLRSDAPVPVYVVTPERRLAVPRVRAFVDFVTPRLRAQFSRLALDATVLMPDSLRPAG